MKAILESKKKDLVAQMEQSQFRLKELTNMVEQVRLNIQALTGAIQAVDEVSNELELKSTNEVKKNEKPDKPLEK
jgi:hypothetical protein